MTEFEEAVLEKFDALVKSQTDAIVELRRLYEQYAKMFDDQQVTVIQHTMPRKRAEELNWLTGPLGAKKDPVQP